MHLSFHLGFNGDCREAFEFYTTHLDGQIDHILTYKESPMAKDTPSHFQDKIVHANIHIGDTRITGADALPEHYQVPAGFNILLSYKSEAKVRQVFVSLSANGQVVMDLQKTFWSPCYGIVTDAFGIPWKINCAP